MTSAERQRRYRAAQKEKGQAAAQEQADITRTLMLLTDMIAAGRFDNSEGRLADPLRWPFAAAAWRLIERYGARHPLEAYRAGCLDPDLAYALGVLEAAARAHHEEKESKAEREKGSS